MITDDLRKAIASLATRLWAVHPTEIDAMPPSRYPADMRGGRRAQFYAACIEDLVADLGRQNAELRAEVDRLHGLPPAPLPMREDRNEGSSPVDDEAAPRLREFWAVVALQVKGKDAEAYVLDASPDCYAYDILINGAAMSDNGDTLAWTHGRKPGVYRIAMDPRPEGVDDIDLGIHAVTPLFELDETLSKTNADQIADLKAALLVQADRSPLPGAEIRFNMDASPRFSGRRGTITALIYLIQCEDLGLRAEAHEPMARAKRHEFLVLKPAPVDAST